MPWVPQPYLQQSWGDGTAPRLYCPTRQRHDEVLADAIDERLVAWMRQVGFGNEALNAVYRMSLGRFVASCYVGAGDLDRLLLCAKPGRAARIPLRETVPGHGRHEPAGTGGRLHAPARRTVDRPPGTDGPPLGHRPVAPTGLAGPGGTGLSHRIWHVHELDGLWRMEAPGRLPVDPGIPRHPAVRQLPYLTDADRHRRRL